MTGQRTPDADPGDLVTIGRFIDPVAAAFARSRLEADGLGSFVQGGGPGSLLPISTVFPILLQVRAADVERATEILTEIPASDLLGAEQQSGEQEPGPGEGR